MTQREKVLSIGLVATALVVGVGFGGYLFLVEPLFQLWDENQSLEVELLEKQDELTRKQQQVTNIVKASPRLGEWKKLSLPPRDPDAKKKPGVTPEEQKKRHVAQLQIEYERYLSELLRRSGFASDSLNITAKPPAAASNTQRGKTPPFERLAFAVTGKTKLEGLVQMLHDFHRTHLLQQVRNLTVTAVQNRTGRTQTPTGELEVNMTVEGLVVNGADPRSALMPSTSDVKPRVLAEPVRSYREMAGRHMFLGVAAPESKVSEDKVEVLRFVRMTTLSYNGKRWEAYLYDLAKGGEERRVNAFTLDEFNVLDKYDNTVLDAKVVHIDERQLIFKADGKFYRLQVGEFLYPAMETSLTAQEISGLGLSPGS